MVIGLIIIMLILCVSVVTEDNVTKAVHKYAKILLNTIYQL